MRVRELTLKSDSKLDALQKYIEEYGEDSHVSEAMWMLHMGEEDVINLIKQLPHALRKKIHRRRQRPSKHSVLKERAVSWVTSMGLRPNTEIKVGAYHFDVVGFDEGLRLLVAVECGGIHNKVDLEGAWRLVGTVYHWPYGVEEPHVLGGCKGCKWWV